MEYCSAIKNNEILPLAATWMDLEGIMLNEIGHMHTYGWFMLVLGRKQHNSVKQFSFN